MKTNMHVIPWDPKDLKREVTRIVRGIREKEESTRAIKAEEAMPTMHVVPWDLKALRQEVVRIVRGVLEGRQLVRCLK